jgi:hypothetical protein
MNKWAAASLVLGGIGAIVVVLSLIGMTAENNTQSPTLSDLQSYLKSGSNKEYKWIQKVTLLINTEHGVVSASSLMNISWDENSRRINDPSWIPSVKGEMPYVKLPDNSYVFSLFSNHSSSNLAPLFLLDGASTIGFDFRPGAKTLESPKSSVTLTPESDLFPLLVRFTSLDDPSSISLYDPLSAKIVVEVGPAIEALPPSKTSLALTWLDKLPLSQSKRSPVAIPLENGRYVVPNKEDFVRD